VVASVNERLCGAAVPGRGCRSYAGATVRRAGDTGGSGRADLKNAPV